MHINGYPAGPNDPAMPIYNCIFDYNAATGRGGAIFAQGASSQTAQPRPQFINCLIVHNAAGLHGGAMAAEESASPTLLNCTVSQNTAGVNYDGLYQTTTDCNAHLVGRTDVFNSIVYGNGLGSLDDQVFGRADITDSCVQSLVADACRHVVGVLITTNPNFVSSSNFRLQSGSPAIDAAAIGHFTAVSSEVGLDASDVDQDGITAEQTPDLDRKHRVYGCVLGFGAPDMGAYEFGATGCDGDVNDNGVVNIDDLLAVINSWGPCPGCPADLTPQYCSNGTVNIDDLLVVINNWGDCPFPPSGFTGGGIRSR